MRIEGVGLHKAQLHFEELEDIGSDSLIRGENMAMYEFKVPMDVSKRRLELFNKAQPMGRTLTVSEYQEPREFDFIWIDYQGKKYRVADLPATNLTDGTVRNFMFGADPDMIDSEEKMYGKQYLRMDITVTGRRGELIDVKMIDDIVICPGIKSPRSAYYNYRDCGLQNFDLNSVTSGPRPPTWISGQPSGSGSHTRRTSMEARARPRNSKSSCERICPSISRFLFQRD